MNNDPFELYDPVRKSSLVPEKYVIENWHFLFRLLNMLDRAVLYNAIVEKWVFTGKEWRSTIND